MICRLWLLFVAMLAWNAACAAPRPAPTPPIDPAIWADDCRAIYQQELDREADSAGLVGCENQILAAKLAGAPVPQDVFRAWLRQQPEWAQHQEDIRVVVLPKLVIRNAHFFGLESGERWYGIEATDFNLFARMVNGEDIGPILDQRQATGYNSLRVFTRFDIDPRYGIGRLRLDEHPELYKQIPKFLQIAARKGFYLDLVAYTGPYTEGFDPNHWPRLCQAVQSSPNAGSVLLSLVNEVEQTANQMDWSQFRPCPGVLSSVGSWGSRMWPLAVWQWGEYHGNSDPEWWRSAGHEPYEISNSLGVPIHLTETRRMTDQDGNLRHACDAGGTSALLNAAGTFHSVHGKNSTLWTGLELDAAREWARCAREVPLSCQDLPYDLLNRGEPHAGAHRIYTRGGSPACTRETSRE